VFDLDSTDMTDDEALSRSSPFEGRFPINVGITGYVATTGEVKIAHTIGSYLSACVSDSTKSSHFCRL